MQKLIEGVHQFRREEFAQHRELFERLAREGQRPHALFITCSDSRVIAELITNSKPGELFVVKNAGNIVPPHHVTGSTNSTAAAIEFAIHSLGISDIVVCGHTQCGAMKALLEGGVDATVMPHLASWLEVAEPVRAVIREQYRHLASPDDQSTMAAAENVLFALENLRTYPVVQDGLQTGRVRLHGWMFKIATAQLFAYDPAVRQFTPMTKNL